MTEPGHHIFGAINLCPVWNGRAVYHQHWQAQLSRGDQLGLGALPAGVLAHHQIDGMDLHQAAVTCGGEWPAINDQAVTRQGGQLLRRVHETQEIMMLRLGSESCHVHPSQRQHDAAGLPGQRGNRAFDVRNAGPAVTGDGLPSPTCQRDMGHTSQPGGFHGMDAHRRGKGVGCVNQMGHAMAAQIVRQPRNTAESTNTHRHRLGTGIFRPSGIAERRRNAPCREQSGESARLGCAAQQEDIRHG